MDKKGQGLIIAGVGGNYEVQMENGQVLRCKARGVFRKQKVTPLIGDRVTVSEGGFLESIAPRKNILVRPAAVNVDQVLVVFAVHNPEPHLLLLDHFLVEAERQGIEAVLIFNKADLCKETDAERREQIQRAYEAAGYPVYWISTYQMQPDRIAALQKQLRHKITVLAGPSGVGKSSLINCLTKANQETGDLSEKIARGKNTTRHARLLPLQSADGWIADTPGFSSFYIQEWSSEALAMYYPEFAPYRQTCRFPDCRHITEPDCAVRGAVTSGAVSELRYEQYRKLYEEVREYEQTHPSYKRT